MDRMGMVVRQGLLFGLLAGVFVLIVRLVAVVATNSIMPTTFSDFVTSGLGLLIIGGAGRKVAAVTKTTTTGLQMGAIAGGISEIFRTVVADLIVAFLPAGQAAVAHMTAQQRAEAEDISRLVLNLGLDLALAVLFGALIGWLGAWSLLQFRPPRDPGVDNGRR
jgi:F0F1-type ATP synthase assembly protein I